MTPLLNNRQKWLQILLQFDFGIIKCLSQNGDCVDKKDQEICQNKKDKGKCDDFMDDCALTCGFCGTNTTTTSVITHLQKSKLPSDFKFHFLLCKIQCSILPKTNLLSRFFIMVLNYSLCSAQNCYIYTIGKQTKSQSIFC